MEPTVHSQKKLTLQLINQQAYRNAISAKMNLASARLFAGAEFMQNKISDMYIEGRINSRPSQPGQVSKIIIDGYWCTVSFVVISFFVDDICSQSTHFLLTLEDDGTIIVAENSHAIINTDSSFEDGNIGDFFNK
jgi:hypothetical protein